MGSLRIRVETWIRDQAVKLPPLLTPPPLPRWSWPPWRPGGDRREKERLLREEYERRRRQLDDLCRAVKADSVADLQEILCSMILSECVYKRPATEMIRVINKFKSDFGGQIISLERVQYSLDHVPHRYLLAEAGDTLFASFIGTKQYKDVIADVNIFQRDVFHEDNSEEFDAVEVFENDQVEDNHGKPLQANPKHLKRSSKPAAHRGFLARAKGIPALELYRLAKRKNRKLVLCGHSLGGAVAALATLAILRVLASSPLSKEHEEVQVKCITFSQPPVGNSALKDYVHRKGWQHSFKSYCIPEDLVPRILSPAYFHHYSSQTQKESLDAKLAGTSTAKNEETTKISSTRKSKETDRAQLVLGLGPVQTSFWRLSKLVPVDSIRIFLNPFKRPGSRFGDASVIAGPDLQLTTDGREAEPQSLEIKEGADGISLTLRPDTDVGSPEPNGSLIDGKNSKEVQGSRRWQRVPYLPSYVPFGQLYLLGSSSVESLSDAEYSKLTSVRSVITELRELFQSHSMKSYRSRFQKIYDHCMGINASPFLGIEQLSQFPNLQQWLGLPVAGAVELGHIVEPPVIQTATSILPLGWRGTAGTKNTEPLKVDIVGHGLHLCTVFQARLNGIWCSTAVETSPSMPLYSSNHHVEPVLQKMRILIGAPLKQPPKLSVTEESLLPIFPSPDTECANTCTEYSKSFCDNIRSCAESFNGFVIYCTSDFITVSKEVYFRTRRVRLVGLEGAGKSSLFKAILDQGTQRNNKAILDQGTQRNKVNFESVYPVNFESVYPEVDSQEAMEGGLCYLDSPGVNLQELHLEASRFKEELQTGIHDLRKKIDLVVLVHNLSQKIPQYHHQPNSSKPQPALSLLLSEAMALGIPWVLAITNKFSVSAHQQMALVNSAIDAYQATPSVTRVVNSCPFVIPSTASDPSQCPLDDNPNKDKEAKTWNFLPQMPFQKKTSVLPAEGVTGVRQLVHSVLRAHEETAFEELANERLSFELAREQERAAVDMKRDTEDKGGAITAAAIGASLGAGLGLVMAVVMGAASALRKP